MTDERAGGRAGRLAGFQVSAIRPRSAGRVSETVRHPAGWVTVTNAGNSAALRTPAP